MTALLYLQKPLTHVMVVLLSQHPREPGTAVMGLGDAAGNSTVAQYSHCYLLMAELLHRCLALLSFACGLNSPKVPGLGSLGLRWQEQIMM